MGVRVISHDSPSIHLADTLSIDFGDQKSDIKDETVYQDNNEKDELNLVKLYANTIRRLHSYPGYSYKWELFTFFDGKTFTKVTLNKILIDLQSSVNIIGVNILGFTSADIGTHSVHASLAMILYLASLRELYLGDNALLSAFYRDWASFVEENKEHIAKIAMSTESNPQAKIQAISTSLENEYCVKA